MTARGPTRRRADTVAPALRSKAAQLADFLKREAEAGALVEPLPGLRVWSRQLGVSRRTLHAAVHALQCEGWFTVHRRGVRLSPARGRLPARAVRSPRIVRLLLYGAYRRELHSYLDTISGLQEQLPLRGLELKWEVCSAARLREIAGHATGRGELCILASVPPAYQRLFAAAGKSACVLGEAASGVNLPFVNVDLAGAVRHAVFRLLRRGFRELAFVHVEADAVGLRSARAAFRAACAEWPAPPVAPQEVATALDPTSLALAARRLAEGVRGRKGFIVVAPVPIGLVVTALLHHGVAIPRQAEVVAVFHSPEAVKLYPPPTLYATPTAKVVKQLVAVATRFFDTGELPAVRLTLAAE